MLSVSNAFWALIGAMWTPFHTWPQVGLLFFSIITAVLALVVWKYTSNQKGITWAKDHIKANFFAMVLFGDSLMVLLSSIGKTFAWIFVYIGRQFVPLIVMMIPILPLLVQVDHLYSFSPVIVDETGRDPAAEVEVMVRVDESINLVKTEAQLLPSGGVEPVTDAVRIPFPQHPSSSSEDLPLIGKTIRERRLQAEPPAPEVRWRIEGVRAGEYLLKVKIGEHTAEKTVVVAEKKNKDQLFQLAPVRHSGGFGDSFNHPGESALTGPITWIEVDYPRRDDWYMWVIIYLIETLVIALLLKKPFKVDF